MPAFAEGHAALDGASGQPLDAATRHWMQTRFGHDFGNVRVHLDGASQSAAQALAARAFTVGDHLAFAPGQYQPGSDAGRRLLAHELAHTLQQGRGGGHHGGAEHAADRAASAALAGLPVPAQPGHAPALQRDGSTTPDLSPTRLDLSSFFSPPPVEPYTVTAVDSIGADERIVHISTGQRYRVWRHRWVDTEEGGGRAPFVRGRPGIDEREVWMTVSWCEGASEGSIKLSADAPEQVLRAIGAAVLSGGDIDAAVRGMSITPKVTANFKIGTVGFRLGAQTTVNTQGDVTGARGSAGVSVNTPAGRVDVSGTVGSQKVGDDPLGGAQIGLQIELHPGESTKAPNCRHRDARIVRHMRVECQELIDVPEQSRQVTERVPQTDTQTHYLYFPYWSSTIDARRSATEQSAITAALGNGFAVASVQGFASPEGSRPPSRGFEGNDELSRQRAITATKWLRKICGDRGEACLPEKVAAVGGSELHTLYKPDAQGVPQEVEGPGQADFAAKEFSADPRDAEQRTPEVERDLARARTPAARAAVVYPQLRRVQVVLTRTRDVERQRTEVTPAHTTHRDVLGGCPPLIRQKAFDDEKER